MSDFATSIDAYLAEKRGDAIEPKHIDGIAAMMTAERTAMCKRKGERDTEFVKRIVATYLNAHAEIHPEVKG